MNRKEPNMHCEKLRAAAQDALRHLDLFFEDDCDTLDYADHARTLLHDALKESA